MNHCGTVPLETKRLLLRRFQVEDAVLMYDNWAIEIKETGELVGNISVVEIREDIKGALLGWCMGTKWWGNEIMPEAGRAVVRYLFEQAGFHRIASNHDKNDPKSGRVMQKIGMTYEGTLRSAGVCNQGIIDVV